jgi:hypothetical protein
LLGGLFGRAAGPPQLGSVSVAIGRGLVVVGASWSILLVTFLAVLAEWGVLLATGARTTPRFLLTAMWLPPLGNALDFQSGQAVGGGGGIALGLGLLVGRALVVSVLTALILAALVGGRPSIGDAALALRAWPSVIASSLIGLSVLLVGGSFLQILGVGLQLLGNVALLAALLHFLGFVPAIAVRERLRLVETLRASREAATLGGGQHFTFCFLYVLVALFVIPVIGSRLSDSAGQITANPSISAWVLGLVASYVQVAFLAAFCSRLLVADRVLAERPAPQPARRVRR